MRVRMSMILLATALGLMATGCTERQRQDISHFKSDIIGLKRTVTLYSADGKPIREWKGRFKVEVTSGTARFLDDDGKAVIIAGTYVIEETK